MTTDEAAFLAAIRDAAHDRTPRLVYADWLDDHGDTDRAELVRTCEAMRRVPVWADEYWRRKARRNELWAGVPADWLAATGYDGSDYDPVFRDGVPDDVLGRWRLIREFTERWHGVAVPDAGGWREEADAAERRLGVKLPPSVREFIAYVHDLGDYGTPNYDPGREPSLFHCAHHWLGDLERHRAVGLIEWTLDGSFTGVLRDDLARPDPPAYNLRDGRADAPDRSWLSAPRLTRDIFLDLFTDLPAAGKLNTHDPAPADLPGRLAAGFPIHARFDDADVYEADEMLAVVTGPPGGPDRRVDVLVRRPIPVGSVPGYLYEIGVRHMTSGLLTPPGFRPQQQEGQGSGYWFTRWMGVLDREREVERRRAGDPPDPPRDYWPWNVDPAAPADDDIPF